MRHASFVLWLDGTDAGWNLNLPICNCEETSTSPTPEGFAS